MDDVEGGYVDFLFCQRGECCNPKEGCGVFFYQTLLVLTIRGGDWIKGREYVIFAWAGGGYVTFYLSWIESIHLAYNLSNEHPLSGAN